MHNSRARIQVQCDYLKDEIDIRVESLRLKLDELKEKSVFD